VHAFEPYAPALRTLQKNIDLNGFGKRIRVCRSALGAAHGRQPLYIPLQNHGLLESSASLNAEFKAEHSNVIDIDVTTLDAYVSDSDISRVGFLKIDVESTEHEVLAGGPNTVARDRPLIVLEVLHLADHEWLDAFCRSNRYRVFTLQPGRIQPQTEVRFHGDAWNQCFCPEEKLPLLMKCAQKAALQITG
jgi:FkbM family methyltransferase